jgi:hypothetical protein
MKKELLVASALVTSLGMAGVAEAASATFSGHTRAGVKGSDTAATTDATYAAVQSSSFSVSLAETLDSGIKVSTGFDLTDENDGSTDNSGLTFTFVDGSKLDIIEAGNSYSTHLATVPSASGEQGVTGTTANSAPTGLDFANTSDAVGFEWHSAADFAGVEGLKAGISGGFGDDGDSSATSTAEGSYSVGLSYATTTGDTTLTVGGGYMYANDSNGTTLNERANQSAVSLTAATGDLTVGVGFASGSYVDANSGTSFEVDSAEIMTAGAKYVSGDMTIAVGYADGTSKDGAIGSDGSNGDSYVSIGASVDYAVISGITATIGFSDTDNSEEGTSATVNSGTAWYIGANVTF